MRILLIGKNGQLGRSVTEQFNLSNVDNMELVSYDSSEFDITNKAQMAHRILQDKPNVIINASAYTKVDLAESECKEADKVNHLGVKALGEVAAAHTIPVIHVSTDYVFDGDAVFPYKPDDSTNPQSVYGKTKLAGEDALQQVNPQHLIIRTAWVFSEFGNNFVKTMVRLSDKEELSVVADQYGCPTYAGDLANCLLTLCQAIQVNEVQWGVYHFGGDAETSWHGFAKTIFSIAQSQNRIESAPKVKAISTEEYPTPALRPQYSSLDCQKLAVYGIQPSNWRLALVNILPSV